jgi:hypothetical protein
MQFGKMHGIAVAVLGVILLGIPGMLYMPTGQVPSGTASSSPVVQHKQMRWWGYWAQHFYRAGLTARP